MKTADKSGKHDVQKIGQLTRRGKKQTVDTEVIMQKRTTYKTQMEQKKDRKMIGTGKYWIKQLTWDDWYEQIICR